MSKVKIDRQESELLKGKGVLIAAVITATVTYIFSAVDRVRANELNTVNAQIEKLYGPLLAMTESSELAWTNFAKSAVPPGQNAFFEDGHPLTETQIKQWRRWMLTVFQPFNVKMENAILNNAQLVVGNRGELPAPFLALVAQTESYKVRLEEWKESDTEKMPLDRSVMGNTTGTNYPESLTACVKQSYTMLQQRQHWLESNLFFWFAPAFAAPAPCQKHTSQN